MEERNRSTYQHSDGYPSNTVIGIPCRSNTTIGIPYPNAAQVPQPRSFNPPRNQTPPQAGNLSGREYAIIVMLICAAIILVFIAVIFQSKDPQLEIGSMVVSPLNVSFTTSPTITAHWDIGVSIRNPSKRVKIKYKQIEASVYYKKEFLTGTILQPFVQPAKNQTMLKVSSAVLDKQLNYGISSNLVADMRNRSVEFNIYLNGRVQFIDPTWWNMAVSCACVKVEFPSNTTTDEGTMVGESTRCNVTLKADIDN